MEPHDFHAAASARCTAPRIRDRRFERTLRRRVRKEVRRSPAVWGIYSRGQWKRRFEGALALLALAMGIAGFPLLAMAYHAALVGLGLFFSAADLPPRANPSVVVLLGPAMLLSAAALAAMLEFASTLRQGREWAVLAGLPFTDAMWNSHLRRKLELGRWGMLAVLGGFVLPGWLWIARLHGLDPFRTILGAALLGLHWPLAVATGAVLAAFAARAVLTIGGQLAVCVALQIGVFALPLVAVSGAVASPEALRLLSWGFVLMPAGWVQGTLQTAILDARPVGWLYLVPIAATIAAGYRWLSRGFAIRELLLSSEATVAVVYERPLNAARGNAAPAATARDASDETDVRRAWSTSLDWRPRGFVERLAATMLSPRERTIVEFWWAGPPQWTRQLCLALPALAAVAALLGSRLVLPADGLRLTGLMCLGVWGSVSLLSVADVRSPCVRQRGSGGLLSSRHPYYPVDYGDALLAAAKASGIGAICWAGPFAATGAAVAWMQGLPLASGIAAGLMSALVAPFWATAAWAASSLAPLQPGNWRLLLLVPFGYFGLGLIVLPGLVATGFAPPDAAPNRPFWDDSTATRLSAAFLLAATTMLWCVSIGWLLRRRIADFRLRG